MSIADDETGRSAATERAGGALRARSVSKSFGATRALDAAALVVRPGRVHAVVGENGAGKSTIAKIVAGIERPDRAEMSLDGRAYAPRDRADARAAGINMVPQQLSLVGDLSLVENLLLVGARRIARRARARRLLAETLERAGVVVDLDIPTSRLSQAQRQLGEIVIALAEGARFLILDEPTASLGPVETGGLFDHLRRLCALGTGIVLITHRLDEVRQVADDVTVLSHGRVVHQGTARGLSSADVARLMVGDLPAAARRERRAPGEVVLAADGVSAAAPSSRHGGVHEVTLALRSGEIVGLAGVSGSGQNLLLDLLAGLAVPESGSVRMDGAVLTPLGALRAGVAWIPEERGEALVPDLTARANLAIYASAVGASSSVRERSGTDDATDVLAAFDVRPVAPELPAAGFSGGNQQKLLVARELGSGGAGRGTPRALLAYGPTQGLDLRAAQAIRDRIVAAADAGAAVLVVSHDLDELLMLADRIVVMFAGRIVADLPAAQANAEVLGAAMAGVPADTDEETE